MEEITEVTIKRVPAKDMEIDDASLRTPPSKGILAKTQESVASLGQTVGQTVKGGLSKVDETLHISAMRDKVGESLTYLGNTIKDKAQELKAVDAEHDVHRMDVDTVYPANPTVSDHRSTLDKAKDSAVELKDKAKDTAVDLKDKASHLGADLSSKASTIGSDISLKASKLGADISDKAATIAHGAKDTLIQADQKYDLAGKADVAKDKVGEGLLTAGAKLQQKAAEIDPNVKSTTIGTAGISSISGSSGPSMIDSAKDSVKSTLNQADAKYDLSGKAEVAKEKVGAMVDSAKDSMKSTFNQADAKYDLTGKADVAKGKVAEGLNTTGVKLQQKAAEIDPNVKTTPATGIFSTSGPSSYSSVVDSGKSKLDETGDTMQRGLEQAKHRAQETADQTKHRAQEGFQQTKNKTQEALHKGEDQAKKIFK